MIWDSYDRLVGDWGIPVQERDLSGRYGTTHVKEELDSLRDRTLFLIGGRDPIGYSARKGQALRDAGMHYRIYPDAGHAINHEFAQEINQKLIRFFLGT